MSHGSYDLVGRATCEVRLTKSPPEDRSKSSQATKDDEALARSLQDIKECTVSHIMYII